MTPCCLSDSRGAQTTRMLSRWKRVWLARNLRFEHDPESCTSAAPRAAHCLSGSHSCYHITRIHATLVTQACPARTSRTHRAFYQHLDHEVTAAEMLQGQRT
jgi:hypothetical protein